MTKEDREPEDRIYMSLSCDLCHIEVTDPPCKISSYSWAMNQLTSLLHDSLVATGHVQHCAIIRRKDISLRASTVGFSVKLRPLLPSLDILAKVWVVRHVIFQPSLDNIHALVHAFNNPAESRREGLKFEDVMYDCVRADKFSVYAKHVRNFAKFGLSSHASISDSK